MILQKIEIQNFRSYYKFNTFELINGFNLIIGSNGDGKTTFYEALEWLFRTDGTNKILNFNLFCNDNVCFRIFAWSATLSTSLS